MTTANATTNQDGHGIPANWDLFHMEYSGLGGKKNDEWKRKEPAHYEPTTLGKLVRTKAFDMLARHILEDTKFLPTKDCYAASEVCLRVVIIGGQQFRSFKSQIIQKKVA